jgi:hypothetical protein
MAAFGSDTFSGKRLPMEIGSGLYLHPTVRTAIDALQAGDRLAWLSCFTAGAKLFDNGKRKSLFNFTRDHIGSIRFSSIERADNDGRDIYGVMQVREEENVHGYLKFRLDAAAMCNRLDIGRQEGEQSQPLLPFSPGLVAEDGEAG